MVPQLSHHTANRGTPLASARTSVVAHPEIIQRLSNLHWFINRGSNLISQLVVTELLESGSVERHLRRMRGIYRGRRDLIAEYLLQLFPQWQWQLPQGGMQF